MLLASLYIALALCTVTMVDIKCVITIHGIPPDAKFDVLESHFGKAGDIAHLLPVQETHSGLFTGRGYVIYKDEASVSTAVSDLTGTSLKGGEAFKFSVTAAEPSTVAEVTTLVGRARLDSLSLSSITGSGVDFVHQLAGRLSKLTDDEVTQLFSEMRTARGSAVIPPGKTSYSLLTPKLPSFSGIKDQTGGYEQWRSHLKTLMSDDSTSEAQVLSAIHQSVKGTAGNVLLSMPEGSNSSAILATFDKYFGNVLPVDALKRQFHSSWQEPKEDVVTWSCRLHRMLDLIQQKQPMTRIIYHQMLRSKFWDGLSSKDIKEATRYRFETDETFDEIFAACRTLEMQRSVPSRPDDKSVRRSVTTSQMASTSADSSKNDSSLYDKLFKRLDSLDSRFSSKLDKVEKRLSKVEKKRTSMGRGSRQNDNGGATAGTGSTSTSDEPFCTRCKRNSHSVDTCHAKWDRDGKPLRKN